MIAVSSFAVSSASEVAVNSSLTVMVSDAALHDTDSAALTGLSAGVSYFEPTSDKAGLYGSANVFLNPSMVTQGGPRIANIQVGGAFDTIPGAKVKLGVVGQAASSSDASSKIQYTAGFNFGGVYQLSEDVSLESSVITTFPSSAVVGTPSTAISLGVSKSIDVL
jgi:hypothetical protein